MRNASWSIKVEARSLRGVSDALTLYHLLAAEQYADMMSGRGALKRDPSLELSLANASWSMKLQLGAVHILCQPNLGVSSNWQQLASFS